jgi:hypothetical protein
VLTLKKNGRYKVCACSTAIEDDGQQTKLKLLSSAVLFRLGDNSCDYIKIDGKWKKVCTSN